jgi:hypothetical protein
MRNNKGVPPGSENNVEKQNGWVGQYTKPKKLKRSDLKQLTPNLNILKMLNPGMVITVVDHNGIFAVVVHYENHCFFDCHWNLAEADAAITLGMLDVHQEFKDFLKPEMFE